MDLIDTSSLSLSIGAIVCVVAILVTKYLLDRKNSNEEDKIDNVWIYSIVSGLGFGILALVMYKQFLLYKARSEILTDSFYN